MISAKKASYAGNLLDEIKADILFLINLSSAEVMLQISLQGIEDIVRNIHCTKYYPHASCRLSDNLF